MFAVTGLDAAGFILFKLTNLRALRAPVVNWFFNIASRPTLKRLEYEQAAEIDAMIQADTAGGMRPHIAWASGGFKVLVREEDALEAREILASRVYLE